jgi:2-(1,2-epoxy-1,2-dihydrophenyl)acetyl-CoA isomerase
VRLAAASSSFVPAFVNIGLVPDTGATYFVVRLLGYSRAFEWLCSGRPLSAADAHAWGLVGEVVDDGRLAARAAELAATFAALPTRALGLTKRLLDRAALASLDDQLELEADLQAEAAASEDFREGIAAFLEKREPRFSGR